MRQPTTPTSVVLAFCLIYEVSHAHPPFLLFTNNLSRARNSHTRLNRRLGLTFPTFVLHVTKRRRHHPGCNPCACVKSNQVADDELVHGDNIARQTLNDTSVDVAPLVVFQLHGRPDAVVPKDEDDATSGSIPGRPSLGDNQKEDGGKDQLTQPRDFDSAPETIQPASKPSLLDKNLQLAPEIAYFYLQNTLGLSEDVMWKITLEAGSVLGMTSKNLEKKVALLRRTMNLSDEDVRTIIERQPTILHMSTDKNLGPTILFLVRALDLSKDELRSIVVLFPCVLCYSMENLNNKLNFFGRVMGYSTEQCRRLLLSEPKLLTAGVDSGLMPRMKFLHREMKIPLDELRSIVMGNPRILLYSLDKNLRPKLISYFIMRLQMEAKDLRRLLLSYPQILDYNLEDHILPISVYFLSELEFSAIELRAILLKFPRLMTHSLYKIKHVVGYLRYELGMNASQVKRVVFQAPQAFGLNTDKNLKSKVEFLRGALNLSEEELRTVISGMPTLIICSVDSNLRPKIDFLLQKFEEHESELKDAIITQPTLLGYSLDKRIKPRLQKLLDIGASPRKITVGITMTEPKFEAWLSSKKSKIEENGGIEPVRRVRKKRDSSTREAAFPGASAEEEETIKEEERRKGRIVHWTRKRRPM